MDFRDFEAYKKDIFDFEPDYLFHLGAYTSLEYCDTNPDDTYETNTLAVENAVHISNKLNIPLLISALPESLTVNKTFTMIGICRIRWEFMPAVSIWANYLSKKIRRNI